jgi:hypothetical protein
MPPRSLENWQTVESLPYVIGNFSWTAMDYLGEAGTGLRKSAVMGKLPELEAEVPRICRVFSSPAKKPGREGAWP